MSRCPRRKQAPTSLACGTLYHVGNEAIAPEPLYRDDVDRTVFLALVAAGAARFSVVCRHYRLEAARFEMLLEDPRALLGQFMHAVGGTYATYFNHRHGRRGHLFTDRYKSTVLDTWDKFEVARAGIIERGRAGEGGLASSWSSAGVLREETTSEAFCARIPEAAGGVERILDAAGMTRARRKQYQARLLALVEGKWLERNTRPAGSDEATVEAHEAREPELPRREPAYRGLPCASVRAVLEREIQRWLPELVGLGDGGASASDDLTLSTLFRFASDDVAGLGVAVGVSERQVRDAVERMSERCQLRRGWDWAVWCLEWALRWRLRAGPWRTGLVC